MAIHSHALSKEQVLIVGCGDLGARVAGNLPAELYQVTGLRRHPPADLPYLHYQACDVSDPAQLAAALVEPHSVILITMTPSERSDAGYERAYVQTCRDLVDGLKAKGHVPRLLMFVSSTAVYGQMDGSWVDEESPTLPDSFSGQRLLEAEQVIHASDIPHVVLRFSGIYGEGRYRLIDQVRKQRASASPHFTNRIHAEDGARAIVHLIERQRLGQAVDDLYLVTDSDPAPMVEVVTWLAQQMGVVNFLSSSATNERGNKRCSNRRLLSSDFRLQYPDYPAGYAELVRDLR